MQSCITLSDTQLSTIWDIKNYRRKFIESFNTNDKELQNKLTLMHKYINLQSISLQKFLTHNGDIGKVYFV